MCLIFSPTHWELFRDLEVKIVERSWEAARWEYQSWLCLLLWSPGQIIFPLVPQFLLCKIGIIIPHELVVLNESDNAWKHTGRVFGTLINGSTCCYHYNEYKNTIITNNGKIIMFLKIILLKDCLFTYATYMALLAIEWYSSLYLKWSLCMTEINTL